ncbi:MAG: hypothetical protein IT308_08550 [Anaerolineaceae bacterium]|nr:hypothetical protein [Anaerolineaceae bacterium]
MTSMYVKIDENPFGVIEQRLSNFLNPIPPDPTFVKRLQRRLITPPLVTVEAHSRPFWLVLILSVGLISGALLFWLFGRVGKSV